MAELRALFTSSARGLHPIHDRQFTDWRLIKELCHASSFHRAPVVCIPYMTVHRLATDQGTVSCFIVSSSACLETTAFRSIYEHSFVATRLVLAHAHSYSPYLHVHVSLGVLPPPAAALITTRRQTTTYSCLVILLRSLTADQCHNSS